MKIGILTFHFVPNYGAVLQCLALSRYLESKGHDVKVIDYKSKAISEVYSLKPYKEWLNGNIKTKIANIIYYLTFLCQEPIRQYQFRKFRNKFLKLTTNKNKEFNFIIYGSDQIWNKEIHKSDLTYWGVNNFKADKHIAYSASAGQNNLLLYQDETSLSKALEKFSNVSAREKSFSLFLSEKGGRNIPHTVDPVFLLDKKQWCEIFPKKLNKRFIFVYNITHELEIEHLASLLSNKTGLPVVNITDDHSLIYMWKKEMHSTRGPEYFIEYLSNAEYVLTSSFHGTALSIIFEKRFIVYNTYRVDRIESLLYSLNLADRFSLNLENMFQPIDWVKTKKLMEAYRKKSNAFLEHALQRDDEIH